MYSYGLSGDWADLALSVVPNVMGFSLGGYAILLAFSNEKFLSIISGKASVSPLMNISSAFVHFIVIQFLSILFSLVYKSSPAENFPLEYKIFIVEWVPYFLGVYHILVYVVSFLGLILFIYSLTTAVAATMSIFRLSIWYDRHLSNMKKKDAAKNDQ